MSTMKVLITRREVYRREVEVDASTKEEAEAIARENYFNGKFNLCFDTPDETEETFKVIDEAENAAEEGVRLTPFKAMKISAKVEWDGDDNEELPEEDVEVTFTAQKLKDCGALVEEEADSSEWCFLPNYFEELFGEYLTAQTDFCHKGFTWEYTVINE